MDDSYQPDICTGPSANDFPGLVIRKNFKKEVSSVLYEDKIGKQKQGIGEKNEW